MEKSLITSLLRVYHSDKIRHGASGVLSRFVEGYNIGQRVGTSLVFSDEDKEDIRKLLLATEGIDATTTAPDQWNGLSRAESLAHGGNEKLTDASVRSDRVAVKALPGRSLLLDGQHVTLPAGANLDLDWHWLVSNSSHATVLLVENWEVFDGIHQVTFNLSRSGENPLVIFRGSPAYRQDHVMSLLNALSLPVFAFVDYDPAGLVIAQSLPHFSGLISPPSDDLEAALVTTKNYQRYRNQLPEAQAVLNASIFPEIEKYWNLLQRHGKALPQEYFLMKR
nr:hypothetical protein [uncultured Pseudogulbenkiania sp.]